MLNKQMYSFVCYYTGDYSVQSLSWAQLLNLYFMIHEWSDKELLQYHRKNLVWTPPMCEQVSGQTCSNPGKKALLSAH